MHWRFITLTNPKLRHSPFVLRPLAAALRTLLDQVTVVIFAIEPPVASAPCELCELCYCLVRVTGECTYLLLASENRCCLTCLGWVTVLPFSVPKERLSFQYGVSGAVTWSCEK